MSADLGQAFRLVINGATYTASGNCLQSGNLNDAVSEATYVCGTTLKAKSHSRSITFDFSLAVRDSDHAILTTLTPGTNNVTDLVIQPNGTTAGNIKITSTDTSILSRPVSWGSTELITIDCSARLNNITIGGNT